MAKRDVLQELSLQLQCLKLSSPLRTDQNRDENKENILAGQDLSKLKAETNTHSFLPKDISTPLHADVSKINSQCSDKLSDESECPVSAIPVKAIAFLFDESCASGSSGESSNPFVKNCQEDIDTVIANASGDINDETFSRSTVEKHEENCAPNDLKLPISEDLQNSTYSSYADCIDVLEGDPINISITSNLTHIIRDLEELLVVENEPSQTASQLENTEVVKNEQHTNIEDIREELKTEIFLNTSEQIEEQCEAYSSETLPQIEVDSRQSLNNIECEIKRDNFDSEPSNFKGNSSELCCSLPISNNDNIQFISDQEYTTDSELNRTKEAVNSCTTLSVSQENEILDDCKNVVVIPESNTKLTEDNCRISKEGAESKCDSENFEFVDKIIQAEESSQKCVKDNSSETLVEEFTSNSEASGIEIEEIKSYNCEEIVVTNNASCDSSETSKEHFTPPLKVEESRQLSNISNDYPNKSNSTFSLNSQFNNSNKEDLLGDICQLETSSQLIQIEISSQKSTKCAESCSGTENKDKPTESSELHSSFANHSVENSSVEDIEKSTVILVSDSSEKSSDHSFQSQGSPLTPKFCTPTKLDHSRDSWTTPALGNCTDKISDCNGFSESTGKLDNSFVEDSTEVLNKSSSAFIVLSPPQSERISVHIKVTPTKQTLDQNFEQQCTSKTPSPSKEQLQGYSANETIAIRDISQEVGESSNNSKELNTDNVDSFSIHIINEKPVDKTQDIPKKIPVDPSKMAELHEILQQENADLKLELNASKQAKAILELEIGKKDEIILKTQAESLKKEQQHMQDIKALKEQLKEKTTVNEKDKDLEDALKEAKAKENQVVSELNARINVEMNYRKIMEEYEKTIAARIADSQKLKEENETLTRHLANLELSFSDLHQKYERSKIIIDGYKTNEEKSKKNIIVYEETVRKQEERYESLKAHARAQIEKSNKEIMQHREKYDNDITKLNAIIKRLEIKSAALETSLEQKTKECIALAALCDEVTGKKV